MKLVIAGIAISYQRIPSRDYLVENLVVQRDDQPVMVEHPGEVILSAIKDIPPAQISGLTLIPTAALPEFGFYLSQLEERFGELELVAPGSATLVSLLHQAASILKKDPRHLIVISETTSSGTAAIAISGIQIENQGIVNFVLPELDSDGFFDFELIGYSGDLDQAGIDTLTNLIMERASGRPVSLAYPGSYHQPRESLLNLIILALAIQEKTLPICAPPAHLKTQIEHVQDLQINVHARPWLAMGSGFLRSAVMIGKVNDSGNWQPILLQEVPQPADQLSIRHINTVDPYLFLINADDQEGLIQTLEDLEIALKGKDSLKTLAHNAYAQYLSGGGKFTCCLLADTRDGLQKEIGHAKSGLQEGFRAGKTWSSPNGSYFTPQPLGNQEIAFVYPGAFNSYPGMAKNLFFSFPGLQEAALEIIPDLSHSLAEDLLYFPGETASQADQPPKDTFTAFPAKLIESGISLSVIYTLILDKVFNLKPAAAFGYSLGETSMLWANQVWHDAQESSLAWNRSPLFKDQLAGKMELVRETWKGEDLSDDFWRTYILKDKYERVAKACEAEDLVSVTIQNSADELIIAGEKNACSRVIQALGCHALPMPLNAAIHHPAMQSSLDSFQELYTIPTRPRKDIRFYSAADYRELALTRENLARSIAQMTCQPVDFPRLVNQVYDDGARIFLEVGPQKTCSRWIEKILKGKPHAVAPINKRYQPDLPGIFKVLALLLSHGVALSLDAIFPVPQRKPIENVPGRAVTSYRREKQHALPSTTKINSWQPATTQAFLENLDRISIDLAESHSEFLAQQSNLTKTLTRVIQLQGEIAQEGQPDSKPVQKALFTHDQIQAFTNGDHRKCFGNQFDGFGNRRFPRLPNGPLQLIDRVIQIDGKPGEPQPGASLVSEVDLPADAWYWKGFPRVLPHVALMEIALQPCGFLSAYLGSIQGREDQDLYFRNLDGQASLLFWPDPLGPVITNRVELKSSSSLNNVIIQEYTFALFQDGTPFFQGNSSFGYFPLPMLLDQVGLDGNNPARSWYESNPSQGSWQEIHQDRKPVRDHQLTAHLPTIDRLWVAPRGGSDDQGYLYFEQEIPQKTWFYAAHFYQDPVMPGSLGVETMARSLMAAAPLWDIPRKLPWRIKTGSSLSWKYRGQITPDTPQMALDLHLQSISRNANHWEICADGQLWNDSRRIYQIDNLCLESLPPA